MLNTAVLICFISYLLPECTVYGDVTHCVVLHIRGQLMDCSLSICLSAFCLSSVKLVKIMLLNFPTKVAIISSVINFSLT